ncbi:MAG: cytochrome c [Flavobacteriales bacterium]|nr:cytochrome c [Flavobacteriales bacterium]
MNRNSILLLSFIIVLGCASAPAGEPVAGGRDRSGAEVYAALCTLCHGADGKLGLSGAKDLTASALSPEEMRKIILDGKGGMAPYRNVLTAGEVDAVVAHVRGLRNTE